VKTREEVEALKLNWQKDPIWDIEDTEGFEEYREELIEFHKIWTEKCDEQWEKEQRKRGGGPAYPVYSENRFGECNEHSGGIECADTGLTIRDYFAGQALNGLMGSYDGTIKITAADFAKYSYDIADAMLAERKKYE